MTLPAAGPIEGIQVRINGEDHRFSGVPTVLEALRLLGLEVPTLCFDPRLEAAGGCRLCLVEVEGHEHPLPACHTPLTPGLSILTHTPALESYRRTQLKLLAWNYPRAAYERYPDKEFHRLLRRYGLEGELGTGATGGFRDDSHPYLAVDMDRCVRCYRCVRICDHLQGQFVWRALGRGDSLKVLPGMDGSLLESPCVSCGACADTCPTGAIEDRTVLVQGSADRWTRTTCPYCGVGCSLSVGTREGRIVQVRPDPKDPVNRGHLCVKGRYAFGFNHSEDRITEPMIRRGEVWVKTGWEEALAYVAGKFRKILEERGPGGLGILASARATNEENYLAQKFARTVLGTNNVDCCARVCHTPTAAAMKRMLGTGAATNSFDDIEKASLFLMVGTNATENHPVVGARIKQRVLQGVPLVVLDPRRTELARLSTLHLAPKPGTNIPLLNAMACTLVEEGLCDQGFIRDRVEGWEEFRTFIREFAPEKMAPLCGVAEADIRRAARLYAAAKPAMCFHGLGVTEHTQGTEGVMAVVNLALLTGNLGKEGSGVNPLRGQNNVQGAAHMGCDPGILTGSIPLAEGRELFGGVWKASLPREPGLNLLEMLDAAAAGKLQGLWVTGYDIYQTLANEASVRKALGRLEMLVVQDLFLNETAREFAHVFLPAASSFEKDGTFMNSDRRVQRVRSALPPPGAARADWEIVTALARAMGKGEGFAFSSPEEIWEEIRRVWPVGRGITYARLERGGLQWPCPSEDHPGTAILHRDAFGRGPRALLEKIAYRPTPETVDEAHPFLMSSGRTLAQFNAGTMTFRTGDRELRPTDLLEMAPEDAWKLGLADGERVRLQSRHGEAVLPVRITPAVKIGELFATFHDPQVFLNRVTSPLRDRYVKACEYKVTAVRVEKLGTPVVGPVEWS